MPDDSLDSVLGNCAPGLAGQLQVVVAEDNLQVLHVVLAHATGKRMVWVRSCGFFMQSQKPSAGFFFRPIVGLRTPELTG